MITGFEEITAPLNDYEQETLLPLIVKGLSLKIGKEKAVTSVEICKALKSKGHKIDGPRLRKIIANIRIKGLVVNLVSNSKGYYIATDNEEIVNYLKSLTQRRDAINALINSFKL